MLTAIDAASLSARRRDDSNDIGRDLFSKFSWARVCVGSCHCTRAACMWLEDGMVTVKHEPLHQASMMTFWLTPEAGCLRNVY